MRRMLATLLAPALLLGMVPTHATAAIPEYQRVISSRHADAAFSMLDGCLLTEFFVGSTDAVFGARPGPVNKQGLTDVSMRISDTCAAPVGKGYPALAMWQGQTLDPLGSSRRLDSAWIHAVIPVFDDVSGRTANAVLDLRWTVAGPLDHDTGHLHTRYPHYGIANSHQNTWTGDAVAEGTLVVDGTLVQLGPSSDAHLVLVKYGCQTILQPNSGGDLDC